MQIEWMLCTANNDMPGNYEPEPEYLDNWPFDDPLVLDIEEIKDNEEEEL